MTWGSGLQTQQRWRLYYFARAAMTRCSRVGGFNNSNLFSHTSGVWKSKIKVLAELVAPELVDSHSLAASSHDCSSVSLPLLFFFLRILLIIF